MEIINLLLGVLGTGIAVWSLVTARSAKAIAQSVILRRNRHEDGDRLRELIRILRASQIVVSHWQFARPQGRHSARDIPEILAAVNALKTNLPIGADEILISKADSASEMLSEAMAAVNVSPADYGAWRNALSALQIIIPYLEQVERNFRDTNVIAEDTPDITPRVRIPNHWKFWRN
jgi:hypothetical protein